MIDSARLAYARGLALDFGHAADELNAAIVSAEQAIASLGLGVPASVPCGIGRLSFGKTGTGWRISHEAPDGQSSPLINCSLETRQSAVGQLPALLEALILSAEHITDKILDGVRFAWSDQFTQRSKFCERRV